MIPEFIYRTPPYYEVLKLNRNPRGSQSKNMFQSKMSFMRVLCKPYRAVIISTLLRTTLNGTQLFGTYLSFAEPAGFRLRNAFNHLVFIEEELEEDILRSPRGEPGSILPKNNSFCNEKNGETKRKERKKNDLKITLNYY